MARKTDITGMADAITAALKDYGAEVGEAVEEAVDKVSKTTLSTTRKTAPKLTGSYRKGWRGRVRVSSKGRYVREIYNKTDYQLTHLLEHGHAKVGGGTVPAIPHLEPAERKAQEQLRKLIEEAIQ